MAFLVKGNACFTEYARVSGAVRLYGAQISGRFYCENSVLLHRGKIAICLDQAKLGAGASIGAGLRTKGVISLVGAGVTGSLSFAGVVFGGSERNGINAENITVSGMLDCSRVRNTSQTMVKLSYGSVGYWRDDIESWPAHGNLFLDGFKYTAISADSSATDVTARLCWLKRQPRRPFQVQPYEQLAQTLRISGHEALARRIQVEKHEMRRKYGGLTRRSRILNWILKITIGHGYKPHRALVWSAAFIVLGGLMFGFGYDNGMMVPSDKNTPAPGQQSLLPPLQPLT